MLKTDSAHAWPVWPGALTDDAHVLTNVLSAAQQLLAVAAAVLKLAVAAAVLKLAVAAAVLKQASVLSAHSCWAAANEATAVTASLCWPVGTHDNALTACPCRGSRLARGPHCCNVAQQSGMLSSAGVGT